MRLSICVTIMLQFFLVSAVVVHFDLTRPGMKGRVYVFEFYFVESTM
ncbi:hypothetical protein PL9631_410036 [Planktothrix paucivesiculata PCC 9631]|uniref:Uncharacterized protein n=1 Tax=Planktothrix paucivesiculata PCC 9631 TaxID=671071 RepID=A0A7Z9E034_9CYAN|nr:hypothetical protein PL9631_410036 [Planktothrix paucivesiculata PCC 9631]